MYHVGVAVDFVHAVCNNNNSTFSEMSWVHLCQEALSALLCCFLSESDLWPLLHKREEKENSPSESQFSHYYYNLPDIEGRT